MRSLILLSVVAVTLAGCGKANEKSLNDSFNKSFGESCSSSAVSGGVPADIAKRICDCAIVKIDEKYSAMEKLTVSDEQLKPLMVECMNSVVPRK